MVHHYQTRGIDTVDVDDVWLGNGVSELISLSLQAMLDNGDEILVPSPDYPLWTAATSLAGGRPVHYRCSEADGWQPDIEDLRSKVTARTKAIVVINPNNPTGAVYADAVLHEIADIAREHGLVVMADEIYDKILYGDATHTPFAAIAPDVFSLTFNGLSKAYRVAGFRSGWMMVSGPKRHAASYLEGVAILANMRLCANVPAQHAVQVALGGRQSVRELILPGGRLLEQRDAAVRALRAIPGVTCTEPQGALYVFPRLDPEVYPIRDDQRFVLELLRVAARAARPGNGFQLAPSGPSAHRHPAPSRRVDRGHRPARGLPVRPTAATSDGSTGQDRTDVETSSSELTLDNLSDVADDRCRACPFWELAPAAEPTASAMPRVQVKEAWVSDVLLEWGSCGQILYVDGTPVGHILYAPPAYVPRSASFPTSPVGADAVLVTGCPRRSGAFRRRTGPDARAGHGARPGPPGGPSGRGVRTPTTSGAPRPTLPGACYRRRTCCRSGSRRFARILSRHGCGWTCARRCRGAKTSNPPSRELLGSIHSPVLSR